MKTILKPIIKKPAIFLGRLAGYKDLTKMHDEWIRLAWDSETPTGIRAFRGSYKTSSVIIIGSIRYLLLNPDKRILLIRKTQQGDASPTLGAISNLIKSPDIWAIFKELYPSISIIEDTRNRFRLSTLPPGVKEASITAFGIGDSITGTHGDVILTDDILNIQDRVSSAERKRTKNAFYELQNIADNGAKQIYNGTCWHERDVWQDIEKIATVYDYPASEYWEKLFSPEDLQKKKESMPATLFAINYELTFMKDESLPFKDIVFSDVSIGAYSWKQHRIYAHVDAAFGGRDTTAFTIICGDIVRGWVWEKHIKDCMQEIYSITESLSVFQGFIETNADKGFVLSELNKGAIHWIGYNENMNKGIKISTMLKKNWGRLKFDRKTCPIYLQQVGEWVDDTTAHDDAPDSLASLLRQLQDHEIQMNENTKALLFGGGY